MAPENENRDELLTLQEESNKLLMEIRSKYEDLEKDRIKQGDFDTFKTKVDERFGEIDELMAKLRTPGGLQALEDPAAERRQKFSAWFDVSRKIGLQAIRGMQGLDTPEAKALQISDSAAAGVLATPEYVQEIIKAAVTYSPMRQLANVKQVGTYEAEFPTRDSVGSASYVNEAGSRSETTGLEFSLTKIPTFEMYVLYKATQKMLEDTSFNLEAEIAEAAGVGFGIKEGSVFYSGDGVDEPEGIITNPTVLADARDVITDNTLAFDDFIGTMYELEAPYAKNAAWAMNRSTLGTCVSLKSTTTNTYLLQPNLQAGQPQMIMGRPVYEWSDFPAITAATGIADASMILAFGDFRQGYTIIDRVEISIQRLVELYAANGMIGFNVRKRHGGAVMLPAAIQLLKNQTS